ncbi:hypothetical protein [Phenylobacterium sp.]|jgi:hypothetical protein|uniref:hypothetical protein n=1 Tax=Phenylobacterium sp. TaxID=1871053 RepID=UPI002F3E7597
MSKTTLFAGALAAAGLVALAAVAAPPAPPAPPAPVAPPAPPAGTYTHDWSWGEDDTVPSHLDWRIDRTKAADAAAGSIDFEMGYTSLHGNHWWGRTIPAADLSGLSTVQLSGAGGQVSFILHRDAGDFRCHGVTSEGRGVGTCEYAANAAFPAALNKRGVAGPLEAYPQFELAMSDMGFAYLDELKRQRYATPDARSLVRAATHAANLKYLTAMDAAGYRVGDVESLIRMRDHGVSTTYVAELRSYGFTGLKADDLVHMRDHGVSASYLKGLADAGYRNLGAEQVARMRDHGVSAGYVAEVVQAGYRLSPEDLERMRDHGVSGGFVGELRALGYDRLSVDEIIKLRDRGVSSSFIRTANQTSGKLSPDELIRLRESGRRP